jgi:hypothetical protein
MIPLWGNAFLRRHLACQVGNNRLEFAPDKRVRAAKACLFGAGKGLSSWNN